ncbi:hypothetical protein TeGR_g5602 [Tetraparma gracilis]|uniref:Oligopeptidase A n=1 Tax=Tetraparma gracilis TaxID=2962635 RepID=A0ABQ6MWM7_9STRA|nr:hypothetical protein TeGR_g5602 [Tetraparma gracilis]
MRPAALLLPMLTLSRAFRLPLAALPPRASGSASCLSSSAPANPYLDASPLPPFSRLSPSALSPAMTSALSSLSSSFLSFASSLPSSPLYDDVLPPLERLRLPAGRAWSLAGHLNGVRNGPELRAAYEEAQPRVVKAFAELKQSREVYDAMVKVRERGGLDGPRARALAKGIHAMKLGGVGLDGGEKERFNEIKQRLATLSTGFSNNVLDVTKAFELVTEDGAAMEGAPESARAMWAAAAGDGASADAGPWKLTLDGPSYTAAMQHLRSAELRERLYMKFVTRAAEGSGENDNVPLISEILELKREAAGMLGFGSYAEQSLSSKMAGDIGEVTELSDMIAAKAVPAAKRELAEIAAFAVANGGPAELKHWDVAFWSERLKEDRFTLKEEDLRPYFALDSVLDGMFGLLSRLFGVSVSRAEPGEVDVWHEDVQFFR